MLWFNENYTYFVGQRWNFDHTNTQELYGSMDCESQKLYEFDADEVDLNSYALESTIAVMLKWYAMKEERARQRKKKRLEEAEAGEKMSAKDERKRNQIREIMKQLGVTMGGYGAMGKWFFATILCLLLVCILVFVLPAAQHAT